MIPSPSSSRPSAALPGGSTPRQPAAASPTSMRSCPAPLPVREIGTPPMTPEAVRLFAAAILGVLQERGRES